MAKFCMKCGTPLIESVRFCPKCGASVGEAAFQQTPVQPQPMYQPQTNSYQQSMAPQQPYYSQTQPYAPVLKKSNIKIPAIIVVVIILIASIFALLFAFGFIGNNKNNSSDRSKIVGTWEIDSVYEMSDLYGRKNTSIPSGIKMTFESNGSLTISFGGFGTQDGTWELKNGKLCIMSKSNASEFNCSDYSLSSDGNTLTVTSTSISETPTGEGYTVTTYTVLKKVTTSTNGETDDKGDDNVNQYNINDILGSWKMIENSTYSSSTDQIWTFYNNGSMKWDYIYTYSWYDTNETSTYTSWYSYELKNNQLCLTSEEYSSYEMCYDFEITNNGNTLTATFYSVTYTFTKIT